VNQTEFNFDQARKLMLAEPNLTPKVFGMNIKTRKLFKSSDISNLITIDPKGGDGEIVAMYGKKVYVLSEMPDNIIGLFLKDQISIITRRQTNFASGDILNWVNSQSYKKNAPFRILNIGYIEIGETAYNNMISDPSSLAKYQFIESEIY
jgi:hypothetical protein